eukprot:SAG11_NODE_26_length_23420_cov_40.459886_19_plen_365_part_00
MQPENGVEYTKCFDQWKSAIAKVNPHITLIGPETYYMDGGRRNPGATSIEYNRYFLNASNHEDGKSPAVISNHNSVGNFEGFDKWYDEFAVPLEAARQALAPQTESVLNEVVLGVADWCDGSSRQVECPNWQDKASQGRAANRKTDNWNHDGTVFAYNFCRLSELGYLYVTSDQLVGGPWPDNYREFRSPPAQCPPPSHGGRHPPLLCARLRANLCGTTLALMYAPAAAPAAPVASVSSLDWQTGEPNAKYWTVRLLAALFGKHTRQLVRTNISTPDGSTSSAAATAHAMGFVQDGQRGILLLTKTARHLVFSVPFASGWEGTLLEGVGEEPGFTPPRSIRFGAGQTEISVGAYAVLAMWEPPK